MQQYIGGIVCQEADLSKPQLEKAQAGELPFQETVELVEQLIAQDRAEEAEQQKTVSYTHLDVYKRQAWARRTISSRSGTS